MILLFLTVIKGSIKTYPVTPASTRNFISFSYTHKVVIASQGSMGKPCLHHSVALAKVGTSFFYQRGYSFFQCPFSLQYARRYFSNKCLKRLVKGGVFPLFWGQGWSNFFSKNCEKHLSHFLSMFLSWCVLS